MENPNVDDDCAKNRQAEWNKAADQEKQTSDYLKAAYYVNVAARKERVQIFARYALRERRHRQEMQERIRTEDYEDQSQENARDNRGNFHPHMMMRLVRNSNFEFGTSVLNQPFKSRTLKE